jgi:hypothetical protein
MALGITFVVIGGGLILEGIRVWYQQPIFFDDDIKMNYLLWSFHDRVWGGFLLVGTGLCLASLL